jgi:hypothetical protein
VCARARERERFILLLAQFRICFSRAGWDGDEDALELSGEDEDALDTHAASTSGGAKSGATSNVSLPSAGISRPDLWRKASRLACHQVAAGRFEEAMRLLNQQICVVQFAPLKEHFVKIYQSSTLQLLIHNALPSVPFHLEELTEVCERIWFDSLHLLFVDYYYCRLCFWLKLISRIPRSLDLSSQFPSNLNKSNWRTLHLGMEILLRRKSSSSPFCNH